MIFTKEKAFRFASNNKYTLLLIFLYLFFEVNNYIWLKLDTYPLLWDSAAHFFDSVRIFDLFRQEGFNFIFKIPEINREYPVFVPLITAPFYIITGISEDAGVFINSSIFLGILIFSVYGITKNIYNKKSGLLAAFLSAAYPIIFGHSRVFMYDLPLTAMVSLIIYLFIISDNFKKTGSSIIFGVVAGFGMLTKFAFFIFIACIPIYFLLKIILRLAFKPKEAKNIFSQIFTEYKNEIRNILIALAIAIIIAAVWYAQNLPYLFRILIDVPKTYGEKHPYLLSPESLSYYFFRLINFQISFFLFLVFILGFCFFLKARVQKKQLLLIWILLTYFIFTFISYKSTRHTLPYLPAIAIISSIGICSIKPRLIRIISIILIIFIATFQFYSYSYGFSLLPPKLTFGPDTNLIYLFNQAGSENAMEQHRAPLNQDWKTPETLNVISALLPRTSAGALKVFIIPDDPRIHSPLITLAYLEKKPIEFAVGSWEYIADSKADIVITKDRNWLVPPHFLERINKSVKWFDENIEKFTLIKKINLPDNSNLLIYSRN